MECDNAASTSREEIQSLGRSRKRNADARKDLICPVCGVTIRANEIDSHFAVELQRLEKSSTICNSRLRREKAPASDTGEASSSTAASTSSSVVSPPASTSTDPSESTWGQFQRIKTNRQARLKTKTRKRKAIENICPVCNRLTSEEIHVHVEKCLNRLEVRDRTQERKRNGTNDRSDEDSEGDDGDNGGGNIDIVGDSETYEEYEWAGQTRIRASSLLPGGNYSTMSNTANITPTPAAAENDEDLNVDGDDTTTYGPSQFTERDVIPVESGSSSQAADNYLRSLIAGDSPSKAAAATSDRISVGDDEKSQSNNNMTEDKSGEDEDSSESRASPHSMQGQILESLKARLKEYEQQSSSARNKIKCQICLEDYKSPLVSISCWHVHCENCWLRSLGLRKLCPKCNMITSAADLRRIYL